MATLGLLSIAACADPTHIDANPVIQGGLEDCPASDDWLPSTPDLPMAKPLPHPTTECPFYRGGWQTFLQVMQPDPAHPDAAGQPLPTLVSYPTVDSAFLHAVPLPANRSYLGDIKQAGGRQILIDQNNNTLYYGIHVNQAYADFLKQNDLQTLAKVLSAAADKPKLFYPAGISLFKSAWQIIEPQDEASSDSFVTMTTTVPHISVGPNSTIIEDRNNPRTVRVRLLAIHIVFTLPGHPEFVWASFEHTDADLPMGQSDTRTHDNFRDVAPYFTDNPDLAVDPTGSRRDDPTVVSPKSEILYKAGTPAMAANSPIDDATLAATFDEASQKFVGQQTSVYRLYPASKSNTVEPDGAVTSLNHNVEAVFMKHMNDPSILPSDKRVHYRLLGAQWMDKPAFFDIDSPLQNTDTNPLLKDPNGDVYQLVSGNDAQDPDRAAEFAATPGGKTIVAGVCGRSDQCPVSKGGFDSIKNEGSDSPFSILAGEDRMSSTAMESFTQPTPSFPNCFACHNTQSITAKGVHDPASKTIMPAGLLNVSHIMTQLVLNECEETAAAISMSCPQCSETPTPANCTLPK